MLTVADGGGGVKIQKLAGVICERSHINKYAV